MAISTGDYFVNVPIFGSEKQYAMPVELASATDDNFVNAKLFGTNKMAAAKINYATKEDEVFFNANLYGTAKQVAVKSPEQEITPYKVWLFAKYSDTPAGYYTTLYDPEFPTTDKFYTVDYFPEHLLSPDGNYYFARPLDMTSPIDYVLPMGNGIFYGLAGVTGSPGGNDKLYAFKSTDRGKSWSVQKSDIAESYEYGVAGMFYANGKARAVMTSGTEHNVLSTTNGLDWEIESDIQDAIETWVDANYDRDLSMPLDSWIYSVFSNGSTTTGCGKSLVYTDPYTSEEAYFKMTSSNGIDFTLSAYSGIYPYETTARPAMYRQSNIAMFGLISTGGGASLMGGSIDGGQSFYEFGNPTGGTIADAKFCWRDETVLLGFIYFDIGGTNKLGLYRSDDAGATWEQIYLYTGTFPNNLKYDNIAYIDDTIQARKTYAEDEDEHFIMMLRSLGYIFKYKRSGGAYTFSLAQFDEPLSGIYQPLFVYPISSWGGDYY